jgi:hypothetical protein
VPETPLPRRRAGAVPVLLLALSLAPGARADGSWLRVDAPAAERSAASLRLLEVRGRATPHGVAAHDLVVALDVSDSVLRPSGWDVDGDGPEGRTDPALVARFGDRPELAARMRESDLDDCVLMAELAAAGALFDRLDLARDRVALVAFSDEAEVLAPLGSPRSALDAALETLRTGFDRWLRGTNFGDAAAVSQRALGGEEGRAAPGRGRSILLLSDGEPTLPPGRDMPRQHALWAAHAAAAAGIRIHAFALGDGALPGADVFAEMAARSGGRAERLEQAGDAIARLRGTDLVGLAAVRVVNATTGEPARALRTFPDGRFDGFVELAPGTNRVRVEALAGDGGRAAADRLVDYDAARPADPAQAEALLRALRLRSEETAAWAEMERQRRTRRLELELRVEPMAPE